MKNTKISAYNGVLIMAVNIILSIILIKPFGLPGIAIAYSAAALIGGAVILIIFRLKYKLVSLKSVAGVIVKSLIACVIMTLVVSITKNMTFAEGKTGLILKLILSGITGVIVYGISLALLNIKFILKKIKK